MRTNDVRRCSSYRRTTESINREESNTMQTTRYIPRLTLALCVTWVGALSATAAIARAANDLYCPPEAVLVTGGHCAGTVASHTGNKRGRRQIAAIAIRSQCFNPYTGVRVRCR